MFEKKDTMKRRFRILCALFVLVTALFVLTSCKSIPPVRSTTSATLTALAQDTPFITDTERPHPVPLSDEIIAILKSKKEKGETDHFGILVEYGLRVHWHYLKYTDLARDLPMESNMMLSELIRIAEIPNYTTAHEAGWLNRQFQGPFNQTGWSSYQIYVWVKENISMIVSDDKQFPNWKRIGDLMETIDNSNLNGIGGGGVCHYGCI